jgi:C-terminal processing protease CtpA/Prc
VFPRALKAITGRSTAPAAVWIGPRCASACEAAAITLSDRPRTALFGMPTAGMTTSNETIDVGHDLTGFYTAGRMARADGRRVDGPIVPQTPYAGDDPQQIKLKLFPAF